MRKKTSEAGGFALVIALSLMAFVLVLLLSLTTLVRVESKSAAIAKAQLEAEQTALLGLNLALGELQKAAGPDQRVTATAAIDPANTEQPHLVGVWRAIKQDSSVTSPIDYDAWKNTGFVQWLSSNDPAVDPAIQTTSLNFPTQTLSNPVELVHDGSVALPVAPSTVSNYVEANAIPIVGLNDTTTGQYAWHIFDESQKANVGIENGDTSDDFSKVLALGRPGHLGYEHVEDFKDLDALDDETAAKLVSYSSLELGSSGFDSTTSNAFHTLTTDSKGLLVDVTQGKFQTDLSLLFAADTLPADYRDRHLYSESQTPIATDPERFGGGDTSGFVQTLPNPDPTWDLLHSHYRLYRDVEEQGGEYHIPLGNRLTNDPDSGVTSIYNYDSGFDLLDNPVKTVNEGFENNQQILPVISNAQFIYSLMNNYSGNENRCNVQLVTDVVVTLWNPYNVNIEVDQMELEFYRFPVSFAFYRRNLLNGVLEPEPVNVSPGDYFHVSSMHHPDNIAGVSKRADWSLRDSVPYRVRITGTKLAPGEFRVFGVTDFNDNVYGGLAIMNYSANYLTHGMVLENGFDETQGGVQTDAIMFRDNGRAGREHGWLYGDLGETVTVAAKSRMVAGGYGGFKDLNGEDSAAFIKIYMGDGGDLSSVTGVNFDATLDQLFSNGGRAPIGSIVLNSSNLDVVMPDIDVRDTPEHELGNYANGREPRWHEPLKYKTPMVIASLRLKTEQSSNDVGGQPNSRKWLNNGITNPYFSNGFADDQNMDEQSLQYELTWEPMTDWSSIPAIEVFDGKGFGGSGVDSQTGVTQAVVSQIPLAPASSLAQFTHAPLNKSGLAPLTSQIVGNSFATPLIERDKKMEDYDALNTKYLDHSYLANSTLFDGYFLSTAVDETNQAVTASNGPRALDEVLTDFFNGDSPLINPSYEATVSNNPGITAASYDDFANYLYNKGVFNVNSTSVEAWALFLASGSQEALPILDALTANTNLSGSDASEDERAAFSRFAPMLGNNYVDSVNPNDSARWQGGANRLTSDEIMAFAENIVIEVQLRGPFQSVSEFVNRRLSSDALGDYGALQAAINASNINTSSSWDVAAPINDSELGGVGTGSTSDGAPDHLTQADILNRLAPSITVRGDTFKIRAYGEAQDAVGNVSSAVCEAVVQRTHDYVDPSDASNVAYSDLVTPSNQTFGRKFEIISFRWLSEDEI